MNNYDVSDFKTPQAYIKYIIEHNDKTSLEVIEDLINNSVDKKSKEIFIKIVKNISNKNK